jgi:hypothetical protein
MAIGFACAMTITRTPEDIFWVFYSALTMRLVKPLRNISYSN